MSGSFFLNHSDKALTSELKNLRQSFEHRAPAKTKSRRGISKLNSYLYNNFFGAKPRYKKQFWNYHSLILEKHSFQLSTNGIESINRSIKHFLGLGMCNQTRLNREMNLFHQQKVNLADAALNHGRMKTIRRQTLANQDSLLNSLQKFEKLSELQKIQNLHYHVLDCGTYTSDVCTPEYFAVLPLMEEIVVEPEISEKSFLENSGFADESIDVPPLEIIPDITELPSFLGKDFENRQCARITRSKSIRYNPIL